MLVRTAQELHFLRKSSKEMRSMFMHPEEAIKNCLYHNKKHDFLYSIRDYFRVCDGFHPLIPFLTLEDAKGLHKSALNQGVFLQFVATERNQESLVLSELHHWVVYDLEKTHRLSQKESYSENVPPNTAAH